MLPAGGAKARRCIQGRQVLRAERAWVGVEEGQILNGCQAEAFSWGCWGALGGL